MSLMTVDDTRILFDGIERHNIILWEKGRAAVSQRKRLMSLHGMTIYVTEYVTSVPEFVGRVIMFFKASVGPGVHTSHSDVRNLAFVEDYWRLPAQPSDPLCSEFGCVRLYSTTPKVYYVMETWRILGPAPIVRNAVHPTIPHGALPRTQAQRQREYPEATEDSKAGEGDGSPQWIVNMWAMMWESKRPTPGELHDNMNLYIPQSPNVHDTIRRRK